MSTSKRAFIQSTTALFVACHYQHPSRDTAVSWAEDLWQTLSERGYGASAKDQGKSAAREMRDYYKALSEQQRKWFDIFWEKFQYKKNRNGAARRWAQLGELTDAKYQKIVAAGEREARKQLPEGQSRKMAEGWLYEHRFEDDAMTETQSKAQPSDKELKIRGLLQDLAHFKAQQKTSDNELLQQTIASTEKQLEQLGYTA